MLYWDVVNPIFWPIGTFQVLLTPVRFRLKNGDEVLTRSIVMPKMFAALAAAVVSSFILSAANADDVYLNDGNHLTGTVTTIEAGNLTLHSAVLGDTSIPLAGIKTFSTEQPIEIHLADGTIVKAPAAQADPGMIALNGGDKIKIADIDEVNPAPFTGSLSLGGSIIRGNSFADTLNAGYKLAYHMGPDHVTATGEYVYGDTKTTNVTPQVKTTTTDRWDIYEKYQHFFSPKFYGYVDADLTKDRIAFLDFRFAPSLGAGYQWFDKAPFKFGTEAGVAWLYQKYTNGTPTHEPLAFKAAYHLTYDFNDKVSLFNDVTYFPTVPRVADYVINADIGLHTKLSKKLFCELKIEWDYDSTPANGALKNDTRYIANIGYSL
jgi:putative salt-induced outer membrane protein YdiY